MDDIPTEKQLALLRKLGHQETPKTKKEAGELIKSLLDKQHDEPKQNVRRVEYPVLDELSTGDQELLASFDRIMAMAVLKTREYNPNMSENDNVFGQITSANADRLVQLLKIRALRELSKK